jgi:hypothetical protein
MDYILSLDYDNVDTLFICRELERLQKKFGSIFSIYQSSADSYHIRSNKAMPLKEAFNILDFSDCSLDYKEFCHLVNLFPIRISAKIWYKNQNQKIIKPQPVKL